MKFQQISQKKDLMTIDLYVKIYYTLNNICS